MQVLLTIVFVVHFKHPLEWTTATRLRLSISLTLRIRSTVIADSGPVCSRETGSRKAGSVILQPTCKLSNVLLETTD